MTEFKEIPAGVKRGNSGQLFEEKAKGVLQSLGFSRIRDAKENEAYDLTALSPENKEAVIEVKGITTENDIEHTWFSIQYEKLWNLTNIEKEIYVLFLTNNDKKLITFDQLTPEYFENNRIRLTVRKGSKLEHDIFRHRLQERVNSLLLQGEVA